MTLHEAFLLLGSNQDDPLLQLQRAIEMLKRQMDITIQSSCYRSEPWGIHHQPEFMNQVLAIKTHQTSEELLITIQAIESQLGRIRTEKWGPRSIDIDILFYENEIRATPTLTLPHPQLQNRRFTLVPLAEIAAGFVHPVLHKSIEQLLEECPDDLQVYKMS